VAGVLWANRLGGVLADDMGLGKTAQTLALIAHTVERAGDGCRCRRHASRSPRSAIGHGSALRTAPFLVVAPTSVASNWVQRGAAIHPGLRVATVTATEAKRPGRIADGRGIRRPRRHDLRGAPPRGRRVRARSSGAGLVLDEAQFVKNAATKVHEAARGIRAPFRLAVTGHADREQPGRAVGDPAARGARPVRVAAGVRRAVPTPDRAGRAMPSVASGLRRRIRPLILRRTKELVAPELPPKQEQVLAVELAPKHRRLYDTMLQRERQKLLGLLDDLDRQRFIVYRSLTLLRMLAARRLAHRRGALRRLPVGEARRAVRAARRRARRGASRARVQPVHVVPRAGEGPAGCRGRALRVPRRVDAGPPPRRRDRAVPAGEASVFLISLKAAASG
jgi:hypothetical protein